MLLIDGVKYELWIPEKEVEEFQPIVKEHIQAIFGKKSKYIEANRLKSEAGIGSVPDGFVLIFGDAPQWHIVEVELSSHQLYDHIVNQVGRFINGIKNLVTQKNIVDAIYREITESKTSKVEVEEAIGSGEIHKFLSDLISQPPILTIIIEKKTQELEEAINLLKYSPIKIVEFQTFIREGIGLAVHAHLFKPLYKEIAPVRNELTVTKNEDIDSSFIFITVANFWIRYKRLRIASKHLAYLSLSHDMSFELETDVGIIKTKIDKWNEVCVGMGKWYKAHPELKAGDTVTFKVLEPTNKYRLEIVK